MFLFLYLDLFTAQHVGFSFTDVKQYLYHVLLALMLELFGI